MIGLIGRLQRVENMMRALVHEVIMCGMIVSGMIMNGMGIGILMAVK